MYVHVCICVCVCLSAPRSTGSYILHKVSEFEATGEHLQLLSKFGQDPLLGRMNLQQMHQVAFD